MTYTLKWSSQLNSDGGPYSPGDIGKATITLNDDTTLNVAGNAPSTSDLTLTGRGLSNYGEIQQQNYMFLLENFASEHPPATPTVGQLWFQTAAIGGSTPPVNQLWVYTVTTPGPSPTLGWLPIPTTPFPYTPYNGGPGVGANTNEFATVEEIAVTPGVFPLKSYALLINGHNTPTANISWGGFQINNLANPSISTDAANKAYVDSSVAGLEWKDAATAATTSTLSASYSNSAGTLTNSGALAAITVDGVALSVGQRVLVKNGSVANGAIVNGIYSVTTVGSASVAWVITRTPDANTSATLDNAALFVTSGTANINTAWTQTTANPTIGTSNIVFAQFSGSGTYVAGTGINITGNTITNSGVTSATAGTGIGLSSSTGAVTFSNTGVTSITGTVNQINASSATGAITLSLPQAIATTSFPTFGGVNLTSNIIFTTGTGAEITPNPTYGALAITGSANNYSGIEFTSTTSNRAFMIYTGSTAVAGVYAVSTGTWDWLFDNNTLYGAGEGPINLYSGSTTATQSPGTNNTTIATTAFVTTAVTAASDPGSSIAANGYQKFVSGLILQWGSFAFNGSGPTTVSFPLTFPHACFSVTTSQPADVSYGYAVPVSSVSASSFVFGPSPSVAQTVWWQATGH